jgi:hypothetical protein
LAEVFAKLEAVAFDRLAKDVFVVFNALLLVT